MCLLAIDSVTGALKSSKLADTVAYKFAGSACDDNPTVVTSWVEDYTNCQGYGFGDYDLATAAYTHKSCLASSVVDQEDEWISSFSDDEKTFATASSFSEVREKHDVLLVRDTLAPFHLC